MSDTIPQSPSSKTSSPEIKPDSKNNIIHLPFNTRTDQANKPNSDLVEINLEPLENKINSVSNKSSKLQDYADIKAISEQLEFLVNKSELTSEDLKNFDTLKEKLTQILNEED